MCSLPGGGATPLQQDLGDQSLISRSLSFGKPDSEGERPELRGEVRMPRMSLAG